MLSRSQHSQTDGITNSHSFLGDQMKLPCRNDFYTPPWIPTFQAKILDDLLAIKVSWEWILATIKPKFISVFVKLAESWPFLYSQMLMSGDSHLDIDSKSKSVADAHPVITFWVSSNSVQWFWRYFDNRQIDKVHYRVFDLMSNIIIKT